jgi:hypothetical protein
MTSRLARGLHASLERGRSTLRGLGAPVLTLQGSSEGEIVLDRAQGSGAFDDIMGGLGRAEGIPKPWAI